MAWDTSFLLAELTQNEIVGIAAGGAGFLILVWFIAAWNGLVSQRMQVRAGWAHIDVELKRRHDLIPNLVEAAKGYMGFEKEVLENVTRARASAMQVAGQGAGAQAGPENVLTAALGRFYAVMENYPDLKSSKNVLQLQEELSQTENKIAFARQHYNDMVMHYNTAIRQIPRNVVAGIGGFGPEPFFEVQGPEREAPRVNLSLR